MGLDSFSTSTSSSSGGTNKKTNSSNSSRKRSSRNEPFKRIGLAPKVKIIQTEEEWNDVVEVIEDDLGYDVDEVLRWPPDKKHQMFHIAIMQAKGGSSSEFRVVRHCMVCEEEYLFPHDWDFIEYKDETVCPDHTMEEVVEEYAKANNI